MHQRQRWHSRKCFGWRYHYEADDSLLVHLVLRLLHDTYDEQVKETERTMSTCLIRDEYVHGSQAGVSSLTMLNESFPWLSGRGIIASYAHEAFPCHPMHQSSAIAMLCCVHKLISIIIVVVVTSWTVCSLPALGVLAHFGAMGWRPWPVKAVTPAGARVFSTPAFM